MKDFLRFFSPMIHINNQIKIKACYSFFDYFLLSITDLCEINSSQFPNSNSKKLLYVYSRLLIKTMKELFYLNTSFFYNQANAEQYLKTKFKIEIAKQNKCENLPEAQTECKNQKLEFLRLVTLDLDTLLFDKNDFYIGELVISNIEKALYETLDLSYSFYPFAPRTSKALYKNFKKNL